MASSDKTHAKSSPDPKQPVDKRGMPISTFNVPGVSRPHGTPGWVSGPAKSATKKAK